MNIQGEIYKCLLFIMLKEKLKKKRLSALQILTNETLKNEKEALHTETAQRLKEINDYYKIMDNFILSDDEGLEASGAYLLEKFTY